MHKSAKVTLCIPLYNGSSTIAATLDSLVNQTLQADKIKVFDNLSTDSSFEIVKKYAEKYKNIELVINETNVGAEGNFTKCLQASEGDYTALVHADDIYDPKFIEKSVAALEAHPECVATFCHAKEIGENGEVTGERFFPKEFSHIVSVVNSDQFKKLVFQYGNFVTCPSVMARSDIYREKIKSWNGQTYKSSADLDVWFRLVKFGSLIAIKEPLINYRVAEASHSFRIAKKRTTRHDLFLVLDNYKDDSVKNDYYFLMLKDQALRTLNIIRNKQNEKFPEELPFNFSIILKKMFQSKWHFKFGVSILGIKLLSIFKRTNA